MRCTLLILTRPNRVADGMQVNARCAMRMVGGAALGDPIAWICPATRPGTTCTPPPSLLDVPLWLT